MKKILVLLCSMVAINAHSIMILYNKGKKQLEAIDEEDNKLILAKKPATNQFYSPHGKKIDPTSSKNSKKIKESIRLIDNIILETNTIEMFKQKMGTNSQRPMELQDAIRASTTYLPGYRWEYRNKKSPREVDWITLFKIKKTKQFVMYKPQGTFNIYVIEPEQFYNWLTNESEKNLTKDIKNIVAKLKKCLDKYENLLEKKYKKLHIDPKTLEIKSFIKKVPSELKQLLDEKRYLDLKVKTKI